jgi:hypothetical protein
MSDESCNKLIERLRGDHVFTMFTKAVTVMLEDILMQTQPAAPSDVTALSHLKQFAANCRLADLDAAIALASRG